MRNKLRGNFVGEESILQAYDKKYGKAPISFDLHSSSSGGESDSEYDEDSSENSDYEDSEDSSDEESDK